MDTNIIKRIIHVQHAEYRQPEEEKLSIQCLEKFYPRHYDILKKMNIQTIEDLSEMNKYDLIENPELKYQNPQMLIRAVHLLGYSFKDEQLTEAAAKVRKRTIS